MNLETFYKEIDELSKKREVGGIVIIMATEQRPIAISSMPPELINELLRIALEDCDPRITAKKETL